MEELLDRKEGVINEPDCTRRLKRLSEQKATTRQAGRSWPTTWDTFDKPVQYSIKLIRWLRTSIQSRLAWGTALPRLRALYATL